MLVRKLFATTTGLNTHMGLRFFSTNNALVLKKNESKELELYYPKNYNDLILNYNHRKMWLKMSKIDFSKLGPPIPHEAIEQLLRLAEENEENIKNGMC